MVVEFDVTTYSALRELLRKGEDFFITVSQALLEGSPSDFTVGPDLDNPVDRYALFQMLCKLKQIRIVDAQIDCAGYKKYQVQFPDGYLDNQYRLDELFIFDA